MSGGYSGPRDHATSSVGGNGVAPVHPALTRPLLLAGVERPVLGFEGMLVLGLAATIGPRLVTVAVAAAVILVIHPFIARLTASEPMLTVVTARHIRWARHYPARSGLARKGGALPTLRPPR